MTSSEQLITMDDWHVVVVIAMRLGLALVIRPLLKAALTINCVLQYLPVDRRK